MSDFSPAPVAVTVDVIVFTIRDDDLQVLLIERDLAPFRGQWAIPGGFVRDEGLEQAARRELREEAGVDIDWLEQLYTFGDPGRDPRMRVVTVAYFALVSSDDLDPHAGTDAANVRWFSMRELPPLAFDHAFILDYALERLRYKTEYAPVAFQLLPKRFTLSELQHTYEVILDRPLDKRNFRRKIQSLEILEATDAERRDGAHRPARLYEFRMERFGTSEGVVLAF